MKSSGKLDTLSARCLAYLRRELPLCSLLLLTILICLCVFSRVHPSPSRWVSDDSQYLNVAQSVAAGRGAYKRGATDHYGGDIINTAAVGGQGPLLERVRGYHFPLYSTLLGGAILLLRSEFLAFAVLHGLLFLGIVLLTYLTAMAIHGDRPTSFFSGLLVASTPLHILYLSISMQELFISFLAMATVYLFFAREKGVNPLLGGALLLALVISRKSFLPLVVIVGFYHLFVTRKLKKPGVLFFFIFFPLVGYYVFGRNGWFWLLSSGSKVDLWQNIELFFDFRPSLVGHRFAESFVYLSIVVSAAMMLFWKRHRALLPVAAFFLLNVGGVILFYNWFHWRHVRVLMWFIPVGYVAILGLFRPVEGRRRISYLAAFSVLLICLFVPQYRRQSVSWERRVTKMALRHGEAETSAAFLRKNYPEIRHIATDSGEIAAVSSIDPDLYFYSPRHRSLYVRSFDILDARGELPGLIIVKKNKLKHLSAEIRGKYRIDGRYRDRVVAVLK
jgi:hypothetical protein